MTHLACVEGRPIFMVCLVPFVWIILRWLPLEDVAVLQGNGRKARRDALLRSFNRLDMLGLPAFAAVCCLEGVIAITMLSYRQSNKHCPTAAYTWLQLGCEGSRMSHM